MTYAAVMSLGEGFLVLLLIVELTVASGWGIRRLASEFRVAVVQHGCADAELPQSRVAALAILLAVIPLGFALILAVMAVAMSPLLLLFGDGDQGLVVAGAMAVLLVPLYMLVLVVACRLLFRFRAFVSLLVAMSKPAPGFAVRDDDET